MPPYEYRVEPMSIAPNELRTERHAFEETLNDAAGDGWTLDEALRVDASSFLFVFRRPVDAPP